MSRTSTLGRSKIVIQFVLGVLGANQARIDQTLHMLQTARSLFGEDFTWSAVQA